MAKIFISYNRQSKAITTTLAEDFEALGHTVWFDQDLSGGQVWWDQILTSVRNCDVFVFVLDPEALNSAACKREYGYAADLGKPILPVLVSREVSINLLPIVLSQIQFVDYREQNRHAAFRIARAVATVPPPKPLPNPLPAPPEVPLSYLGRLAEQVQTASSLSYVEQSTLVVDLKQSLRDPRTADDTRTLLARLRRRRDLFAAIAEEIDELLGSPKQAPSVPPRTSVPEPSPKVDTSQVTFVRLGTVVGAVAGGIFGPVTGAGSDLLGMIGYMVIAIPIGAIVGAIVGEIISKRRGGGHSTALPRGKMETALFL